MEKLPLILVAVFVLVPAERAAASDLYYVGTNNGAAWNFGTISSSGSTTSIATGLSLGGAYVEKLMFAPNGTLYGFDVGGGEGGSGAWGTINPATGALAQIGSLVSAFPGNDAAGAARFTESQGFSLAFGPSGILYATGYGADNNLDFGTLNLTSGGFTKISAAPFGAAKKGSIAACGNTIYYVGTNNGSVWTFGTINASGGTTSIATGLSLGGAYVEKLMFAPNGTLYGFDVGGGEGGSGAWGTINPATGAFAQIGSLVSAFPGNDAAGVARFTESQGFSLAFGPSGTLYATGYGADNSLDFGTLNLTSGSFTKISTAPLGAAEKGSIAAPVPEPSTFVLLAVGATAAIVGGSLRGRCAAKR